MKNKLLKLFSALLCIVMVMSFAACSSKEGENTADTKVNNVDYGGLDVEFKYSKDCSSWSDVEASSELFRADGNYQADDTEIVYLHFKNHTDHPITYKVAFRVIEGAAGNSTIGIVEDVRSPFASAADAVAAVEGKTKSFADGYVYAESMSFDSAKTVAVVLHTSASAAQMKLRVDYSVVAHEKQTVNAISSQNGVNVVNANCYSIVNNDAIASVLTNDDGSFKVNFAAGSVAEGSVIAATVKSVAATEGSVDYDISVKLDGKAYNGEVKMSIFAGYGLAGVEVLKDGAKIDSTYDMYSGLATFTSSGGKFTVKYSGNADITGVLVQGADQPFANFNKAIEYAAYNSGEIMNIVIFGRAEYTVQSGEKICFTTENSAVKTINIIGGNSTAEILITQDSGSVPSLPYANDGVQINYSNITFQSENELQVDGEYSRHFDYRGEADISFTDCTFKKALATRGPNSNVVVKNCNFVCPTYNDTFKGYCYYSVQKIGGGEITVELTNNDFTGCWGGVNLDWAEADFIVTDNKFGGYNCSKPAIQLSHAHAMLIENNSFSNIKDENAFRFYSSYNGQKTSIINNTFEKVDYMFQSDVPSAISTIKEFKFEGNTISKDTDLTLGHEANAPADAVSPHWYTIDTNLNTIK